MNPFDPDNLKKLVELAAAGAIDPGQHMIVMRTVRFPISTLINVLMMSGRSSLCTTI